MALVFGPHARTTVNSLILAGETLAQQLRAESVFSPRPALPPNSHERSSPGCPGCRVRQQPDPLPVPEGAAAGLVPETCLPDRSIQERACACM